jgi:hypothetical protein
MDERDTTSREQLLQLIDQLVLAINGLKPHPYLLGLVNGLFDTLDVDIVIRELRYWNEKGLDQDFIAGSDYDD